MNTMWMKFPLLAFAPDEGGGGAPSGGSSSASEGGGASSSPTSPSTSTPPSSSGAVVPEGAPKDSGRSVPDTGGLRDAGPEDNDSLVIPDLGFDDEGPVPEVRIPESIATGAEGTPATPSPQTPVPPAVATPQEGGQQPQTPPAAAAPQDQAPQPQAPQQPVADLGGESVDPMHLAAAIQQNEAAVIDALAAHYALSPQEVEAMQQDAFANIPRLLAKVHSNVLGAVFAHMSNLVPRMVAFQNRAGEANKAAESKFFEAWPQLDKGKHGKTVAQLARLYRQANPQAQLEDVIKFVGPWAMNSLGIPLNVQPLGAPPAQGQGQVPVIPPSTPNGHGNNVPPPFVPSLGGTSGGPPQPAPEGAWDGLGRDFDDG